MIQDALDGCEVNAQLAKRLEQVEARNRVQVVAALAGWATSAQIRPAARPTLLEIHSR